MIRLESSCIKYSEKCGWALFAVAFVFVASFHLRSTNRVWLVTPDSTDYVEGARSIVNGEGFVDLTGRAITLFPPGTSVLYSIAAADPRNDYLYFNIVTKLLLLGYLIFSYLFLRKVHGSMLALFGFLVLSFSMVPVVESTKILSDIPFAFAVALTLFLFGPERLQSNTSVLQAVLLGLLLTMGYCLRTEAIWVFGAYFLYILVGVQKNKKRTLIVITCIFLCGVSLWAFRNAQHKAEYSYLVLLQKDPWVEDSGTANLADWGARIIKNSNRMIRAIGRAFTNRYDAFWFGIILSSVAIVTLVHRKKYSLFCCLLILCYFPLHLTPRNFQDRYLISLLPVLLLLILGFFRIMIGSVERKYVKIALSSILVLLAILSPYWGRGYRLARHLNKTAKQATDSAVLFSANPDFQKLVVGYNSKLTARDVIACPHPNVLRYLTPPYVSLKTFLLSENVDRRYQDLRKSGATYLYVDLKSTITPHMLGVLAKYASQFVLISSNSGGALYKIRFDPAQ